MDCAHPVPDASRGERPLGIAFAMTAVIFVAEIVGGWWTGSLALLADAAHMGIDLAALGLGLAATHFSRKPPDSRRTFGYQRVEVLAALANAVSLLVVTGMILREAFLRWLNPTPVLAIPMIAVAVVGLACNATSGMLLYGASRENINLRGVFLHVISDLLGSLGVIAGGLVMLATGWQGADPIASVLICGIVIFTSVMLFRDSVHILLEGAPTHLDLDEIRAALSGLPGVREVHDLHLWSLSKGSESLSGHLVLDAGGEQGAVLKAGTELLRARFGLNHVTLQIESET